VDHILEIPDSYEAAVRAMAHQYVFGGSAKPPTDATASASLETLDLSVFDQRALGRFLVSGVIGDEVYLINDLFQSIGENHLKSFVLRQYVVMSIYLTVLDFVEKLGFSRERVLKLYGDIDSMGGQLATLEYTRQYLTSIVREALRARDEKSLKRHGAILRATQEYINEHFGDADLSLNTVAKAANISPTHFSAIFSQEMGSTFIEYLTHCRMEKAKELLVVSDMRSSEIAGEVGYKDSHYFSFLFKKVTGYSPREFRAEKRKGI
jgi:two-component system response regulator YesN